jgi:predicted anti-sigma-YlaC factor YlaD
VPRLPPVPEDVQEANRRRIGFFKWIGVAVLMVGFVLALVGIVAGGIAALEVPGYGLMIGGLAYLVIRPLATRLLDPRPYGSSRQNRE